MPAPASPKRALSSSFVVAWSLGQIAVLHRAVTLYDALALSFGIVARTALERDLANKDEPTAQAQALRVRKTFVCAGLGKLLDGIREDAQHQPTGLCVKAVTEGLLFKTSPDTASCNLDVLFKLIRGAMRAMEITEPVCLEWAAGDGGGAVVIRQTGIEKMTTAGWLLEKTSAFNLRVAEGRDIEPGNAIWSEILNLVDICRLHRNGLEGDFFEGRSLHDLEKLATRMGAGADEMRELASDRVWHLVAKLAEHAAGAIPDRDDPYWPQMNPRGYGSTCQLIERVENFVRPRIAQPAASSFTL